MVSQRNAETPFFWQHSWHLHGYGIFGREETKAFGLIYFLISFAEILLT